MAACLLALALLLLPWPARAIESGTVTSKRSAVTLVSETDSYRPGQPFRLGLRFQLAPGWHIYWVNAGEAGTPPELSWTLPEGASASAIAYPAPERLQEGPFTAYGYTGSILLPVTITPPPGDAPFIAELSASWLICDKICVPEEGTFRLSVPSGAAAPSRDAPLFAAADARLPRPSPFAAHIAPDGTLTVAGQGIGPDTVGDAWFFPSSQGAIDGNAPQSARVERGRVDIALAPGRQFHPHDTLNGVLVLRDPGGGETVLAVDAMPGPAYAAGTALPLARTLGFAFLGGLLLNLMPCVFPVLAMKALGIARLSGRDLGEVRAQALSYTGGVVVSFVALGLALLGLRSAGSALGWGSQFQSPVFVAGIAWLLFVLGLNLSGVFEIGAGRFAGAGEGLASRPGHAGSFFTGVLAVVVATPCTAPFMGTAIAAALTGSAAVTLGVFALLGLGLAAPYAVLAAAPRIARLLPRPGPWMTVLRQALAFPLYAACAWLLWVVSQQVGDLGVLAVAVGFVLLGCAAWAAGWAQRAAGSGRVAGWAIAGLAALGACALLPRLSALPAQGSGAPSGIAGERFSAARLSSLIAEGRPVFVDMTAAWCVTCLVNEQVALSPQPVRDAFAAKGVVYMKGDWTRQNPEITAFLRDHGRDGVPLYVLYAPNSAPVILPQVLTEATVLEQLARLRG
ncbi:MAG: thioredoxin family protein [Acetobacteraceae bacterium]|nr:thioredoxin family protein [Acetobacteraceae bacterium]